MDTADSQHLSRISRMLLAAVGVAFAWVLLSIAFGFSASQAHADEDPGLLGSVTGVVEDTATGATGVVEDTTTAVEETAEPIVEPVVETVAPVVATVAPILPVAPVVEAVEATVTPVLTTVTDVAEGGVVAPVVDTVLSAVGTVPVVGGAVSALGVDTAASSVGSSVDGVLQGTTGAVVGSVTDAVDTVGGVVTSPGIPVNPDVVEALPAAIGTVSGALSVPSGSATAEAVADPFTIFTRAVYFTGVTALASMADMPAALRSPDASFVGGGAAEGFLALLRSVLQADSVLIGPGGAGPGAWVLVALGFVVAYRAWMRRSGLENDVAPAAPTLSTDVSPD